jgi:hypothetical protein
MSIAPALTSPKASSLKAKLARAAIITSGVVAIATGFIGVMHMPFAKSLLKTMGGCPVGNVSAAELERATDKSLDKDRAAATHTSQSHTLFGFELGVADYVSVSAWAKQNNVSCESKREDTWLHCTKVAIGMLPAAEGRTGVLDELSFNFATGSKKLRSLNVNRFRIAAQAARDHVREARTSQNKAFGEPSALSGDFALPECRDFLSASASYRFTDLSADVMVTCLPQGANVREFVTLL